MKFWVGLGLGDCLLDLYRMGFCDFFVLGAAATPTQIRTDTDIKKQATALFSQKPCSKLRSIKLVAQQSCGIFDPRGRSALRFGQC